MTVTSIQKIIDRASFEPCVDATVNARYYVENIEDIPEAYAFGELTLQIGQEHTKAVREAIEKESR